MFCKKCKSTKIKSRTKYSHGKKSKGKLILICKECNSNDIEMGSDRQNRNIYSGNYKRMNNRR